MDMHVPGADSESSAAGEAMRRCRSSGVRRLLWSITAVAALWLVVLPWLGGTQPIARRVQWLDDQGIDPSAMYYTELEAMKPILKRLNERQRNGESVFRR
jgi:hypothetical protein